MGLECFKYSVLVARHKRNRHRHKRDDLSMTPMDNLALNGSGEGSEFAKVDFNCLKGQYPITLQGINIFQRANEHLKIGVFSVSVRYRI